MKQSRKTVCALVLCLRSIALFTLVSFITTQVLIPSSVGFAQESKAQGGDPVRCLSTGQVLKGTIAVPPELGQIDEVYLAPDNGQRMTDGANAGSSSSSRTIVFIQDAHDSLEAQENIAKLIEYFVTQNGVKTVFEEGYEGPVPTGDYFGFIKDPELKRKVAYFFLDHLRLGGAEFAHINRTRDFQLIGADSLRLHKKSILQYRLFAEKKEAIRKDLKVFGAEIRLLAAKRFPRVFLEWLKLRDRFDAKQLDLFAYLGRTLPLVQGTPSRGTAMPLLSFLSEAVKSHEPVVIEKAKHIDTRDVYAALIELENEIGVAHLKDPVDQELFAHYKVLGLLKRLNDLQVTQEEYEAVKKDLQTFDTESLGRFIHGHTQKPLVLSKQWEKNILNAIKFYEIAAARDHSIETVLKAHFFGKRHINNTVKRGDKEDIAMLVYGGFHKENIKRILESQGISYVVINPRITKPSPRHEAYYKKLMTVGSLPFEHWIVPATATRPQALFEMGESGVAAIHMVYETARSHPGVDASLLERYLTVSYPPSYVALPSNRMTADDNGGRTVAAHRGTGPSRSEIRGNRFEDSSRRHFLGFWMEPFLTASVIGILARVPANAAEQTIFTSKDWKVIGTSDNGPGPSPIKTPQGVFTEIKVDYKGDQLFSVKGNGYIRGVLPSGYHGPTGKPVDWGTSFVLPGYWSGGTYHHNSRLIQAQFESLADGTIALSGTLEDENGNFQASDFKMIFKKPFKESVEAEVLFTLKAKRSFSIDTNRVANHEGFKILQFSSMNIGAAHDSDFVIYQAGNGKMVRNPTTGKDRLIVREPQPLKDGSLYLANEKPSSWGYRPTVFIQMLPDSSSGGFTPQGWIAGSSDPNSDNLGAWIHFDRTKKTPYLIGETIVHVHAVLGTTRPGLPLVAPSSKSRSEARVTARNMPEKGQLPSFFRFIDSVPAVYLGMTLAQEVIMRSTARSEMRSLPELDGRIFPVSSHLPGGIKIPDMDHGINMRTFYLSPGIGQFIDIGVQGQAAIQFRIERGINQKYNIREYNQDSRHIGAAIIIQETVYAGEPSGTDYFKNVHVRPFSKGLEALYFFILHEGTKIKIVNVGTSPLNVSGQFSSDGVKFPEREEPGEQRSEIRLHRSGINGTLLSTPARLETLPEVRALYQKIFPGVRREVGQGPAPMSLERFARALRIREKVNVIKPNDKKKGPFSVLYFGAGFDLVNVLVTTGADEVFMTGKNGVMTEDIERVDRWLKGDFSGETAIHSVADLLEQSADLVRAKAAKGFSREDELYGVNVPLLLWAELRSMGVEQVSWGTDDDGLMFIEFEKPFLSGKNKDVRFYFVQSGDLTNRGLFNVNGNPQLLKVIGKEYNAYFQNAGQGLGYFYDHFIDQVRVKEKGFWIVDDHPWPDADQLYYSKKENLGQVLRRFGARVRNALENDWELTESLRQTGYGEVNTVLQNLGDGLLRFSLSEEEAMVRSEVREVGDQPLFVSLDQLENEVRHSFEANDIDQIQFWSARVSRMGTKGNDHYYVILKETVLEHAILPSLMRCARDEGKGAAFKVTLDKGLLTISTVPASSLMTTVKSAKEPENTEPSVKKSRSEVRFRQTTGLLPETKETRATHDLKLDILEEHRGPRSSEGFTDPTLHFGNSLASVNSGLRIREPAVIVIEKKRLDALSHSAMRQLMGFAAINKEQLRMVVPDYLEGKESPYLGDLKALGVRITLELPETVKDPHVKVIGLSDKDGDTVENFKGRLDPGLARGVKEFFALEGGAGIFLALLVERPEDMPQKNGFRYDKAGRYQAELQALFQILMTNYVVISSAA